MTRKKKIILLVTTTLCGALALTAVRAHDVPRGATGFVSHTLCSAAFVSKVDPDEVYAETVEAMPGVGLIAGAHGFGVAMTLTAIGPMALAVLVIAAYPETARKALEEINPEDAP